MSELPAHGSPSKSGHGSQMEKVSPNLFVGVCFSCQWVGTVNLYEPALAELDAHRQEKV